MGIRLGTLVLKDEWDGKQAIAISNRFRYIEDVINNLANNAHAHAYANNINQLITIATTGTPVDFVGMTADQLYGFTFAASSTFTCNVPGHYLVIYSLSFKAEVGTSQHFEMAAAINNIWQASATMHITTASSTTNYNISGNGIVELVLNNTVKLQVQNLTLGNNITLEHANFSLTRVYL